MEITPAVFIRSLSAFCLGFIAVSACRADDAKLFQSGKFSILLSSARTPDSNTSTIEVTLKNQSSDDVYFITRELPVKGEMRTDLFEVRNAFGQRMEYLGIYEEGSPTEKSKYTLLRKGEAYKCSVDLSRFYNCDEERYIRMKGVLLYFPVSEFDIGKPARFEKFGSNILRIEGKRISWLKWLYQLFGAK